MDNLPENIDFFDFLALIDREYERLKWSHDKRKKHLIGKYGRQTRYRLSDEQLFELYGFLRSQPAKSPINRAKIGLRKIGL